MKIPFLIFLVSGLATLQLEPLATRGAELASQFTRRQMHARSATAKALDTGETKINCLKAQLEDVQLDMMKVFEADREALSAMQSREEGLKYALRAEQVRRDEIAQCRRAGKKFPGFVQLAARCFVSASGKPQS